MATADGFVVPHLRRSIDASRAMAMQLMADETEDGDMHAAAVMPLAEQAIAGLLRLLEDDLGLRVVFIADPARQAPHTPTNAPEDKPLGAGIGAPIRLADGRIFGMLCFFRREPDGQLDERDVRRLEMSSRLAARLIDGADAHGIPC